LGSSGSSLLLLLSSNSPSEQLLACGTLDKEVMMRQPTEELVLLKEFAGVLDIIWALLLLALS
jgi:hypothetical protein